MLHLLATIANTDKINEYKISVYYYSKDISAEDLENSEICDCANEHGDVTDFSWEKLVSKKTWENV